VSEANRPTVPVGARTPERAAGVPLGVARLDGAGMVIYVNARAAELVGYAREEMLGRNFAEFFFEEDRPQALADFDQRRHGIGGATENRLLRKDGTSLWVTVASEPTFSADGDFLGVTGFFTDIDGQRRQQEFFVHERRLLRQIAGNYPLSSVLDDLCVTLEAISRRPLFVAVMLADGKLLKCVAAPNLSPRFRADRAAIFLDGDTTPCADAVRNGCEVIVGDATQIEAAPCLDYGFTAVWSYPIVQDGETLGTLALFLPAPGEPDAEDRRAIEFALQVARLALTHERNTLALRASEQRFRDYAELAADWYWEQDADFRFTSMSGGVFNKGGFRVAESLGKTRWELPIEGVSEAQWAEHRTLLARHEAFQNFAYTIRAADGSLRWYSASGKPVFASDGKFLGYRGTSRDISAQKFAEDELRASEQRFRDFAELSADWFWEQDADLRFSRMSGVTNDREERAGFRVTEVLGKMRWELPAEGVDAAQWAEHRAVLARRETFKDFVYALRVANGSLRWFSLSGWRVSRLSRRQPRHHQADRRQRQTEKDTELAGAGRVRRPHRPVGA
jgi:PAS domain S-box-containing protein